MNRLRPLAISLIRESTSSASFLTEIAASLMRATAPFVPGEPRKFLGGRQDAVDLVGGFVDLCRHLGKVFERRVDVAPILITVCTTSLAELTIPAIFCESTALSSESALMRAVSRRFAKSLR